MPSSNTANRPTGPAPMIATSVSMLLAMHRGSYPSARLSATPPLGQIGGMPRVIELSDLAATEALAAAVAGLARTGDTILLEGELGAGKSVFARAFLRAATGDPALEVPSPTFTLVQSYDTRIGTVHHFDLWRHRADP